MNQHAKDKMRQMEDQFFLPAIYERIRNDVGSRVVKKPERFGGEIDILFNDTIPIELKVRVGRKEPLDVADLSTRHSSPAARLLHMPRSQGWGLWWSLTCRGPMRRSSVWRIAPPSLSGVSPRHQNIPPA